MNGFANANAHGQATINIDVMMFITLRGSINDQVIAEIVAIKITDIVNMVLNFSPCTIDSNLEDFLFSSLLFTL